VRSIRGRSFGAALALVLLLGAFALARPATAAPASGPQLLGRQQVTQRLQALRFRDPSIGEANVQILLPDRYDASGRTRYPVLYLLHGAASTSDSWVSAGDAERITRGYPLIVVIPDGGYFGFYADWWGYGIPGAPQWETWHLDRMIPWIDAHYPTVARRDGRAIAGDSMGGLGTMHYAAKRPDLFTAAFSFSGAIDTSNFVAPPIVEALTALDGDHLPGGAFGLHALDEVRWRGHNPVDLAENLRGVMVTLDTGNGQPSTPSPTAGGDPVEMAMYQMGATMHARLDAVGIAHTWDSYGPGCHCWLYWQRDLRLALPRMMARFAHPVPAPSPFTYRTIDASWSMYGWKVAIDRPALEFSQLSEAGPTGFHLTGSGPAVVTTAATFRPGQRVVATIRDAGGSRHRTLTADSKGRLVVPVSLGPANPYDEYSPVGTIWNLLGGGTPGTWPSTTATVTFAR
jgi:S-formylglutathione hydrolase FrmB